MSDPSLTPAPSDPPGPGGPQVPPPGRPPLTGSQTPPGEPDATPGQAAGPAIPLDEHGAIAVDLACRRCAYDLRGLREDGRCPECGTPIGLSTRGDLLRFADPDWLSKVARGLKIILWMILVGAIVGAVVGGLQSSISPAVGAVLMFGTSLISFYGVWLMTEPDPSGIGEDPNITARKVVRITLLVGLVSQPMNVARQELSLGPAADILLVTLLVVTAVVGLVGEFAKFIYYERLGARIPDEFVVRRARFLRWAFTICFGIVIVGGALLSLAAAGGRAAAGTGSPLAIVGCLMLPVGIAFIVFSVMTLLLLLRLRRAIAEQARLARMIWTAATQ